MGSSSVTSLERTACGVHSPTAPFHDPVAVALASVRLHIIPNVAADCSTKSEDRRCCLSFPRRENSRNDAATTYLGLCCALARLASVRTDSVPRFLTPVLSAQIDSAFLDSDSDQEDPQ